MSKTTCGKKNKTKLTIRKLGKGCGGNIAPSQAQLSFSESSGYLCEQADGDLCTVDTSLTSCTCPEFKINQHCFHIAFCKDIYTNKGRNNIYTIYSCFHKSIRLGLTEEALNWLDVLRKVTSESTITKYVIQLTFEESRFCEGLFNFLEKKSTLDSYVRDLTLCKKKWELDYFHKSQHFNTWIDTHFLFLDDMKSISQFNVRNLNDLFDAYKIYWLVKFQKDQKQRFWEQLLSLPDPTIQSLIKHRQQSSYALMTATEIITGVYTNEANELHSMPAEPLRSYIPLPKTWCEDIHTHTGWARFKKFRNLVETNTFTEAQLDLRASGMVSAVGFRFTAKSKFGSVGPEILKTEWQSVPISQETLKRWLNVDSFFYPKLKKLFKLK